MGLQVVAKKLLLGKAEYLANCSVCIDLLWGATLAAAVCWLALSLVLKLLVLRNWDGFNWVIVIGKSMCSNGVYRCVGLL